MSSTKGLQETPNIFMKPENSKISDLYRLLLNLSDKTDLNRSIKYVALSNFSIYYTSTPT